MSNYLIYQKPPDEGNRNLKYKNILVKINPDSPEPAKIKLAAEMLTSGKLVAFPTETVYGLGANVQNKEAVNRLYQVKHRPANKPLTLHIADMEQFRQMVGNTNRESDEIIRKFWPGPLTLIIKDRQGKNIGLRMPDNKIALNLIRECKVPVVAPSANISGRPAPVTAQQVIDQLDGKIDLVLDGGPTRIGMASTVLDISSSPYRIIREGAISLAQLINSGLEIDVTSK